MSPKYSICIPNLNMGDTIEVALRSVLIQLNNEFEVVVVDDGSTDKSLKVLDELKKEFSNLKVIPLRKDRRRTLAQTRNISIELARGEYVILHIDCDDYWHPYILDFVKVYHLIEGELGKEFLMSGFQFHMGDRDYLMKHGPYRNGHMVEDRDMWFRFAKMGTWVPIDHVVFRERMSLKKSKVIRKKYLLTIRIVRDEIRANVGVSSYFHSLLDAESPHSFQFRLYKCLVVPVAWISAKFLGKLEAVPSSVEWSTLKRDAWQKSGTILEFFKKRNKEADLRHLSENGQWIFSNTSNKFNISDLERENSR